MRSEVLQQISRGIKSVINHFNYHYTCFGAGIIMIRMKASKRPASVKGIIIPPIMMSTGALMFVIPFSVFRG